MHEWLDCIFPAAIFPASTCLAIISPLRRTVSRTNLKGSIHSLEWVGSIRKYLLYQVVYRIGIAVIEPRRKWEDLVGSFSRDGD